MDHAGAVDKSLIPALFELGVMAHRGARRVRRRGELLLQRHPGRRGARATIDPSISVFVDVQNTLVNNCLLRWFERGAEEALPAQDVASEWVGSYALSEAGVRLGRVRAQDPRREARRQVGAERRASSGSPTARRASLFIVFANADPSKGYKGITAFVVERELPGFTVGKKEDKLGIRAFEHHRARARGLRGARRERASATSASATRSRSRP